MVRNKRNSEWKSALKQLPKLALLTLLLPDDVWAREECTE